MTILFAVSLVQQPKQNFISSKTHEGHAGFCSCSLTCSTFSQWQINLYSSAGWAISGIVSVPFVMLSMYQSGPCGGVCATLQHVFYGMYMPVAVLIGCACSRPTENQQRWPESAMTSSESSSDGQEMPGSTPDILWTQRQEVFPF